MHVGVALLIPLFAAVLPDLAWFYLGRSRGGKALGLLCKVSLEPDSCGRSSENLFRRHGTRTLLIAKFVPGLSTLAPQLAGMVGMSIPTFILYDTAGSLLWIVASEGVGHLFSNQQESMMILFDQVGEWILIAALIGIAIFIGHKFYRRQQVLREHRMAKISTAELKGMMDGGSQSRLLTLETSCRVRRTPKVFRAPYTCYSKRLITAKMSCREIMRLSCTARARTMFPAPVQR